MENRKIQRNEAAFLQVYTVGSSNEIEFITTLHYF
ncbi:MAG: hypothetical protein ACI9DJ_002649 [Algoriphagus sp.]|jgi:hypothetical protein